MKTFSITPWINPSRGAARRPPALRRAFTLIELVLALALTVSVAAILSGAMFTVFHAKNSINEALDQSRAGGNGADILPQELANCLPPTPSTTTTIRVSLTSAGTTGSLIGPFEGLSDSVDFFTSGPEPKADLQPDVREVQYELLTDPDGGQMLVRHVFTNPLATVTTQPPDVIVCHNVLSFALSYYDGTNWNDTWDSTQKSNALPLAVQITLELTPRHPNELTRLDTRMVPVICAVATSSTTGGN